MSRLASNKDSYCSCARFWSIFISSVFRLTKSLECDRRFNPILTYDRASIQVNCSDFRPPAATASWPQILPKKKSQGFQQFSFNHVRVGCTYIFLISHFIQCVHMLDASMQSSKAWNGHHLGLATSAACNSSGGDSDFFSGSAERWGHAALLAAIEGSQWT
jgi:hypothetical protein